MNKLILVTNDDSIHAKGIKELVSVAKTFGQVIVVAPDKPQSGMGHAITISNPLRIQKYEGFKDVVAYECSGTPVDCVKIGIYEVMKRKPDLVVSGINHGSNAATNVLYSGTMSAAVEGAMEGISSVGFSLESYDSDANFEISKKVVEQVIKAMLNNEFAKNICLNVNIPNVSESDFKGIKIARQGHAFWEDRFEKRNDQFNKPYYWLAGDFLKMDAEEGTDLYWLEKGFASIVPTKYDLTAFEMIDELTNWKL